MCRYFTERSRKHMPVWARKNFLVTILFEGSRRVTKRSRSWPTDSRYQSHFAANEVFKASPAGQFWSRECVQSLDRSIGTCSRHLISASEQIDSSIEICSATSLHPARRRKKVIRSRSMSVANGRIQDHSEVDWVKTGKSQVTTTKSCCAVEWILDLSTLCFWSESRTTDVWSMKIAIPLFLVLFVIKKIKKEYFVQAYFMHGKFFSI